ncbi:sensor histidine kinase [Halobaculum limi]|uniref:sensor histidine kinase n=1 Tax=Halobaculum limi TaxID=3031916 RepID=UPI0024065EF5|nr:PAS domain-containing sensor histidine kinase [Halobaculum sp. YSMS11]
MSDRTVSPSSITDLRESLLYVLADAETFDAAVERTLAAVCRAGEWEYGESWLPAVSDGDDDPADHLVLGHTWAAPGYEAFAETTASQTFGPGEGLIGRVWSGGGTEWIADLSADDAGFTRARAAAESDLVSGVAIRLPEGAPDDPAVEPIAVLAFLTATPREEDFAFARAAADIVAGTGRLFSRRRRDDAISDDRRLLDTVLDVTPHPIVLFDDDGEIQRFNAAAETAVGIDAATARERGRLDEWWDITTPDGNPIPKRERPVSLALRTGETADRRLALTLPSGDRRTLDLRASPVLTDDGDVTRVVAAFDDVTDRLAYQTELEARNAELDRFASVISHDLRNPLAVIEGYVDLAIETGDTTHLDRVKNAVDRVNGLVDSLLVLARHGQTVGDLEAVPVDEAVSDAWQSVGGEDATLVVDEDLPVVEADPVRLGQLLENLLTNALTHAGEDVTVSIESLADGSGFAVGDDGPGIDPAERDRIFDPGVQSGGDGLGLGLALVRSIAEAHDWRVHVEDGPDGGARFVVEVDNADSE